jgi:exopolyphosphatase/guanosine-5'-triphosphate,3'-diphosphate pyrophosphatase
MRIAALDLGSNTFLMLVADLQSGKIERVIADELRTTRLGQGVHHSRSFHPEALVRAEECLREYAQLIKKYEVDEVVAVATSAARDVKNGQRLLDIGERLKIPIKIIPGKMEAEITFNGATSDRSDQERCSVIDVGGGSTEIVSSSAVSAVGESLDIGSVRLTELCLPEHPAKPIHVQALLDKIKSELAKHKLSSKEIVIAVAGTPTTIAALEMAKPYSDKIVHGFILTEKMLEKWFYKLAALSVKERQALPGLDSQRAEVIVAGTAILWQTARTLGASQLITSTRGVRYGVALAWEKIKAI